MISIMDAQTAGRQAAKIARAKTLKSAEKIGLRTEKALAVIKAGLGAGVTKAALDKAGDWTYSKRLTDHQTRLRAAEMTLKLFDAFPAEKQDVDLTGALTVNIVRFTDKPGDEATVDADNPTE